MKKVIFILILLLVTNGLQILAKETINKVSLKGTIVNSVTQSPIIGATIRVDSTNSGAISRNDGTFEIKNLKAGIYTVKFTAIGYQTYVKSDVNITNVNPVELQIDLIETTIQLDGVEVRGSFFIKNSETVTSTQSFSAEEIRRAPGIQQDVVRATSLLPGVGVINPGRNDLIVRGGAAFENLFIVDNIEIPNINHFGSQGSSGGPLSIINIDFVNNVTFSAGGFGAQFGDKTSSLTKITLRNGNTEKIGGKAIISASQFGAQLEGPIGNKASFILNARRSYLDLIFKAADFAFIPEYWDFFAKFNWKLDELNTFSFVGIGTLDDVFLNNSSSLNQFKNSQVAVPEQKQYFVGLTWKHLYGNGFSTVTFGRSYTNFNTFQEDSTANRIFQNISREGENSLDIDFDFQLSPNVNLNFGNQTKYAGKLDYDIIVPGFLRTDNNGIPRPLNIDTTFSTIKNSTFASVTTSFSKFKVTVGGRFDFYSFTQDKVFLSPRIAMLYQINNVSGLLMSVGRYFQSPSYIWLIGDKSNQLNPFRADQAIIGYEHTPMEDIKVQLEAYYKVYNNYMARVYRPQAVLSPSGFENIYADIPFGLEPLSNGATGFSQGLELSIQKKWRPEMPLYGIFSVTWSQTKFRSIEGIEYKAPFDSPLMLNMALGYRFGDEWEISYKYRTAIGVPTSPYLASGKIDYSQYNQGERLPIYHATDIRIDKRWNLGSFYLDTFIDVQNVFATKNAVGIRYNYAEGKPEYQTTFGILPSIGVEFEF
jgi:hypothetical protein